MLFRLGFGAAAAHDRERAVLRARFAARDGGVEAEEPEPIGFDRELARDARGNGGVVDEQHALRHRLERAVSAERPLREIVVASDARQDDVGTLPRPRAGSGTDVLNGTVVEAIGVHGGWPTT